MSDRDSTTAKRLISTRWPGIYARDGRYVVQVVIAGRKVQRTADTVKEARALKAELQAQRHRGTFRHDDRRTLAAYATSWLAGYQGRTGHGVRAATVAGYRRDLDLHVLPALGGKPLGAIKPTDVKALAAALEQGAAASPPGYRRAPLSVGSVRNAIAPLRALYADALVEGAVTANPCTGLRLAGARLGDRKIETLSDEQVAALVAATPAGRDRCLVQLAAEGGLRFSELMGLRWGDLDLGADPPRLRVERAWVSGVYDAPKSSHGRRTVPLSRALARELKAWRLASRFSGDEHQVFCGARGRPLDNSAARRAILDPAAKAAGLAPFGWHRLRHTAASSLLARGVPPLVVSRLLGHHSATFTLDVYGHVGAGDLLDLDALAGAR